NLFLPVSKMEVTMGRIENIDSINSEIGRAVRSLSSKGYVVCLNGILAKLAEERINEQNFTRRRVLTRAIETLI
ncbi:hypothetical protein, partial [Serratia marcescens]|uniref:hypothetical protein n=1 Tax=Serratia marcescens TaxID=615 RepID=UPI002FDABB4B